MILLQFQNKFIRIVKWFFHKMNLDLVVFKPHLSKESSYITLLKHHDINVVFDIGANEGQYAEMLIRSGYKGRIISFEPQSLAYKKLKFNSSRSKRWIVAPRCAIGEKEGKAIINISKNSLSSSVLPILKTHTQAAPESKYKGKENIKMCKLDTIYHKYVDKTDNVFLKIDTQGYESNVLRGSVCFLKRIKGIQIETSLLPLYKNELLFKDVLNKIEKLNFGLWRIDPGFTDQRTGRTLQVDCLFFKKDSA